MTMGSLAGSFPASLIRELAGSLSTEAAAESAVPSYTHWNPAIRWLMFRRLEVIRRMTAIAFAGRAARGRPSVLDFGCGIGMMIPALARHVDTLYLCDEQLAPARATSRWFEATNVVCLPPDELDSRIGDSSLDVIIAADVLEHVEDLPTVIATLRRKLRSGAALIASGPTESIAYRCGRWVAGFSGEYHLRDVFDVEDALRRAPFARRQLRRLPFSMTPAFFRITSWRRLD